MRSHILPVLSAITWCLTPLLHSQINLGRPRTQFGTHAQRPSCPGSTELYLYRDTGSLLDNAICSGSWIDRRGGVEMKAPSGTWTWVNQGGASQGVQFGRPRFDFPGGPGWHGAWLPFTGGTAEMCVSTLYGRVTSSTCQFALVHEDGDGDPDNDKLLVFGPGGVTPHVTGSITLPGPPIQNLTTVPYDTGNADFQCGRVEYDPVTTKFDGYWSLDGVQYPLVVPVPVMGPPSLQSAFIPKGFGFMCDGTANVPQSVIVLHHQ